ncbi:MAG: 16S rRNA (guanine(966)-N(2))-methyltransferase RsmD [Cyanobacteriota bacterium]|nr:16S rRNA (guanine(966)-N(2))-methyltransferase RsmD [Cyanobacteriota bacterium]MDY6359530.1 16S rRNA (guanine(966)-N(2))-methyltransferase RsmD [Cyanobacteriota bacterium]MDY6364079.1 16S rRNA (guanine(966)-N(2))-methyltransferase RsmD [Cyanobacteriota bacterium]MDY6382940.1 16S rRNA (guanine(966)-N(2))-methyltransferase RsmD [Cyanobacteriota bacterium]
MNITGGIYNRQKIAAPDESITRPTLSKIRMSVFNMLSSLTGFEDKSFLDMFAGSGIMGLEAISRGFGSLVSIEKNKRAYNIIKSNFSKYEKHHDIKLLYGDSLKIAPKSGKKFDVIYIDPPYFSGVYESSLAAIKDISNDIAILEHVTDVEIPPYFEIIKQKKYGEKFVTFLRYNNIRS